MQLRLNTSLEGVSLTVIVLNGLLGLFNLKTTKFILAGTPAMTSTSKKLEKSMALLTLLFWKADNTTKSGVKFICYQKRQLKPIKT